MRKIIVSIWMTLDGYIAGPNGEMDWVNAAYDEAMGAYESDIVSSADTLLLGRKTYESFAGAWPNVPDNPSVSDEEKAYALKVNAMNKVVFSKTLGKAEWEHSTLATDIAPEDVRAWKQEQGKDMLIYGSASIVQQLTNLGLIDEYQILVHPVILGGGKRLFEGIEQTVNLRLVDSIVHPSGVVRLTYRPLIKV